MTLTEQERLDVIFALLATADRNDAAVVAWSGHTIQKTLSDQAAGFRALAARLEDEE